MSCVFSANLPPKVKKQAFWHCAHHNVRKVSCKYKLDAESRKLRALESRRGPELSAFECIEDATKGPPRCSNARSFHDEASKTGLELWQRVRAIQIRCS